MTIPTTPPYDVGPLMRLERERLVELLRGLDAEEWALPTPCPGWSVLDLVVHVVGTDLSWVSWHRDDHHGTPPPVGLDGGGFIAWLDQLQIEWVDAARRVSPALAVELLGWLGGRLEETIAGQDPAAVTATVSWASDALVPAWLDQVRELTERWIHRQQLLEALGRADDLRADLADPVLQGLRWAYPYRLGRLQRPPATAAEIEVLDDDLGRRWRLVTDGSDWSFDETGAGDPAASMRFSAMAAWRLPTNNVRGDVAAGIDGDGDPEIVDVLLSTRAIIGAPHPPTSTAELPG